MENSVLYKQIFTGYIENLLSINAVLVTCGLGHPYRWWWTLWYLFAANCARCPARQPKDSAHLSRPSLSKFLSLAHPSAPPSWREQRRILTEPWSKKDGERNLLSQELHLNILTPLHFPPLFREVKLSVVSYLTNSIMDQILQELYTTHKTLVLVISLFCMTSFVEM